MKSMTATGATLLAFTTLFVSGAAFAQDQHQDISLSGSRPSTEAPAQFFTGRARITPLFAPTKEAPITGGYVTFEPGARSAWHTHPTGQRLVIIAGTARTQVWGGPVVELKPGDVLWCPPGVKHWHGASSAQAMTHLALTGTVDAKNVTWMEKVTDEQYGK
jgi:quercetin dioxygenase-like cupin family protein